jgi:hypothetical protein
MFNASRTMHKAAGSVWTDSWDLEESSRQEEPCRSQGRSPFDEAVSDSLLDEVLTDPSYRDNARKLQKAIAEANGLSVAADLVEESLGVTKKAGKA